MNGVEAFVTNFKMRNCTRFSAVFDNNLQNISGHVPCAFRLEIMHNFWRVVVEQSSAVDSSSGVSHQFESNLIFKSKTLQFRP